MNCLCYSQSLAGSQSNGSTFNPLTPISDKDRISPCNINTISTTKVTRIKKTINLGIIS